LEKGPLYTEHIERTSNNHNAANTVNLSSILDFFEESLKTPKVFVSFLGEGVLDSIDQKTTRSELQYFRASNQPKKKHLLGKMFLDCQHLQAPDTYLTL